MKKFSLIFAISVLIIGLLSWGVFAQQDLEVLYTADNSSAEAVAEAFSSVSDQGSCNKFNWATTLTSEVHLAQWIDWHLSGTKWTWFVRKPGDYYTDCISATVKSNADVVVTFSGFADLSYKDGTAVNETISTWYGYSDSNGGPIDESFSGWTSALDLNNQTVTYPDSAKLHEGWTVKLWNRINVVNCNTAGTYSNTGNITISVTNQQPFIDGDTGQFKEDGTMESIVDGTFSEGV